MTREEYEELTKADLVSIADERGIKIDLQLDKKMTIIDKLMGMHQGEGSEVKPAKAKDVKEPPLGHLYDLNGVRWVGRMFDLEIFATEQDKSDVDIIVNGHNLRVKRGEKVRVPEPYVEVLRNAVIETIVEDQDSGKRYVSKVMTFPHTAVPVAA